MCWAILPSLVAPSYLRLFKFKFKFIKLITYEIKVKDSVLVPLHRPHARAQEPHVPVTAG